MALFYGAKYICWCSLMGKRSLGKIKNGTFYHLKNNKKHTQISICLCGAAGSAQPW